MSITSPVRGHPSDFLYPEIIERGFSPKSQKPHRDQFTKAETEAYLKTFCAELKKQFKRFRWDKNPCGKVPWRVGGLSHKGNPLVYWSYGTGKKTTLLLSGVHPDELTPIPIGFRLATHILNNPKSVDKSLYKVVIAPLVNPDGFLRTHPSRTNSQGVDLNRNFLTFDWYRNAIRWWAQKKNHSRRHFPGFFPNTEPETKFQVKLIHKYLPDKIMSIHAPLGFLDYDGPGDRITKLPKNGPKPAKKLAHSIAKKSRNYRVVDYSYFPGSLGNFAGNELKIPTVTLELKTTNPQKVDDYWKQFLPGMIQSIEYPFERFGQSGQEDRL